MARLYELRNHVHTFLEEANSDLADNYTRDKFIATLAYMADIFTLLNNLNTSFQGKTNKQVKSVFVMYDKIAAFKAKLDLWKSRVEENEFDMFDNLAELIEKEKPDTSIIKDVVIEHLTNLRKRFDDYFPVDPREANKWIRNPYSVDIASLDLPNRMKAQIIDIVSDGSLENVFKKESLVKFWVQAESEYPEVGYLAIKFLMPFTTTWMCEAGFSAVTYLKSKYRNNLETIALCANLRIALSPIRSRIDELVDKKQTQPSH